MKKGSTATAYEPYSNICPISGHTEVVTTVSPTTDAEDGTSYTTTLGRTVYGGTLDVVSGELVVDRAMVDLSTLTWSGSSGIKLSTSIANMVKAPSANNIPANIVAEKYATSAVAPISANDGKIGIETTGRIQCGSSETPSGMLCYELATPQTYQLTPQTISLLHGNNNVWSDGSVELTYNADVGLYIDKKLGTSGTRTLSMTRTVAKSEDTDDTKSDAELTKSDNIQLAED